MDIEKKWDINDREMKLKNLIEDYADVRCEIFYHRLNNNLADIIDTKEYKDLYSKKVKIKEEINSLIGDFVTDILINEF